MRPIISITMIAVAIAVSVKAEAQAPARDTIYYLVDTAHVPTNDRLVEIGKEGVFRYFAFKCACLSNGKYPTFLHHPQKNVPVAMDKRSIKGLKLMDLPTLLDLCRKSGGLELRDKVVIFIERIKRQYYKFQVRLYTNINRETNIDQMAIPKKQ